MAHGLLYIVREIKMHEISAVLAGTYDQSNTVRTTTNVNAPTYGVSDSQRYSKFDHSASQVADATMSFGDVLDMINPLQHIPVVSAAYRSISGDTINPVSRVAGDILYGAALGPAAALAGGVGAIADVSMQQESGHTIAGAVYASLFGDENAPTGDATTQLAAATETATTLAVPVAAAEQAETAIQPTAPASSGEAKPAALETQIAQAQQGIPLVRNKLPYGGAMAPVKNMQEQNMAMAVASATGGLRIGNTVYADRLVHGVRSLPPSAPVAPAVGASAATNASATESSALITALPTEPNPTIEASLPSTPLPANFKDSTAAQETVAQSADVKSVSAKTAAAQNAALPSALSDDSLIMRALGVYQNVAAGAAKSGGGVNLVN